MLLLLPLPLPLLMLLFSDFCCYQQHTLNVLFSPHLTFQSDWDVLVVVVADADAAAGVAVVLAPFFVSFFVCQLLLHQQLRGGRSSCLLKCFLKLLLLLLFTLLVNTSCWWARSITVTIGKWHSHHSVCRIHVHGDTFTHNTLIHPRRRCRCGCRWWCAKCSRNVRSNGEVSWYFSAPCRP